MDPKLSSKYTSLDRNLRLKKLKSASSVGNLNHSDLKIDSPFFKTEQNLQLLSKFSLLKNSSITDLEFLIENSQLLYFEDGKSILKKGQVGRTMFLVLQGNVECSDSSVGTQQIISENSYFGEIGVLFSVPRTCDCIAKGKCTLLGITKGALKLIAPVFPELKEDLIFKSQQRFSFYVLNSNIRNINIKLDDSLQIVSDTKNTHLIREYEVGFLNILIIGKKTEKFKKGDLLVAKGDCLEQIYFILNGKACIFFEDNKTVYQELKPGKFFGAFYFSNKALATVGVISDSIEVIKLTKKNIDYVLNLFPGKSEIFLLSQLKSKSLLFTLTEMDVAIKTEAKRRYNNFTTNKFNESNLNDKMSLSTVRETLKNVPMFKSASTSFLDEMATKLQFLQFQKAETIVKMNSTGNCMYFLISGSAEFISEDKKTTFAVINAPSFFGEVSLLYGVKRTATVRAQSEGCSVLELSKSALITVLNSHPETAKKVNEISKENHRLYQSRTTSLIQSRSKLGDQIEIYGLESTVERVKKVPMFSKCDLGFLRFVALSTSVRFAEIGDYIIKIGQLSTEMYFIVRGTVEVVSQDGNIVFDTIAEGGFFGEIGVITGAVRTASIRVSSNKCDLISLSRISLDKIFKCSYESYQKIVDEAQNRMQTICRRRNLSSGTKRDEKLNLLKIFKKFKRSKVLPTEKFDENLLRADTITNINGNEELRSSVTTIRNDTPTEEKNTNAVKLFFKHIRKSSSAHSNSSVNTSVLKSFTFPPKSLPRLKVKRAGLFRLERECFEIIMRMLDLKDKINLLAVSKDFNELLKGENFWLELKFDKLSRRMTMNTLIKYCNKVSTDLEKLDLTGCYFINDSSVNSITDICPNLSSLNLSNCWNISDTSIKKIGLLKRLRELDISYCNKITGHAFETVVWAEISSLNISYLKNIRDEQLDRFLCTTTGLKSLFMRRCVNLTDFGLLSVVRYCKTLQDLDLKDCSQISGKCISTNLKSLNLTFCSKLSNISSKDIMLDGARLVELNLSFCTGLNEEEITNFLKNGSQNLKFLNLRGTRITDNFVYCFMQYNKGLKKLDLSQTNISWNAIQHCLSLNTNINIIFGGRCLKN
ncbi:hypothetical protein HDU92_006248 [Lobulomyces angularis]|nr:hypothetical protein HDU92_006248 [Lobulomyces angularis]